MPNHKNLIKTLFFYFLLNYKNTIMEEKLECYQTNIINYFYLKKPINFQFDFSDSFG